MLTFGLFSYGSVAAAADVLHSSPAKEVITDSVTGEKAFYADLEEVVINPGKRKYSKKNNPAVDLMQRIRKSADSNNPVLSPYYSYDKYEKIILGVNDFNVKDDSTRKSRRSLRFLQNYTDTAAWSGKRVLNLMCR